MLPGSRLQLLLIRRSNDLLAGIRLAQITLCVWEPAHETPVEQSRCEERVDVPDGKAVFVRMTPTCCGMVNSQMFTTIGNADGVERHAVDEAGERRREAHDKRDDAAPVGGVARGVTVHAVEVVHVGDRHVASPGDVVAIEALVATTQLYVT
jgi:hypothetical protein